MSSSTTYQIPKLPLNIELESKEVLKQMDDTKTYMNPFQDLKIAVAGTGYVGLRAEALGGVGRNAQKHNNHCVLQMCLDDFCKCW